MNSAERGAGAGDGAWEKLAGCGEAGAATGIGGANGRAEDSRKWTVHWEKML